MTDRLSDFCTITKTFQKRINPHLSVSNRYLDEDCVMVSKRTFQFVLSCCRFVEDSDIILDTHYIYPFSNDLGYYLSATSGYLFLHRRQRFSEREPNHRVRCI